jgi:hypothetical protein
LIPLSSALKKSDLLHFSQLPPEGGQRLVESPLKLPKIEAAKRVVKEVIQELKPGVRGKKSL